MTIKSIELIHLYEELWKAEDNENEKRANEIREEIENKSRLLY